MKQPKEKLPPQIWYGGGGASRGGGAGASLTKGKGAIHQPQKSLG